MTNLIARVPVVVGEEPPRPDVHAPRGRLIITIDGPAGTGKSSVARELAATLGLEFLDTGAMYRGATALALDRGIPLDDGRAIAAIIEQADLQFDWNTDPPSLLAFRQSMMHRLRENDVSSAVSPVSSLPEVREVLVRRQQQIGLLHSRLVSEGRDQGSVVFADACVKIYLDASPAVRASRRAQQLRAMGQEADIRAIERDIIDRDRRDMNRTVGPLVCPQGAVRFDTSDLSQDQVVEGLARIVRDRVSPSELNPGSRAHE